jgi:RNA polymerase sigma-70 factor, ECF subfamily
MRRPVWCREKGAALSPDRQLLESALLVVRYQRGDQSAFPEIVALWERSLFYYLRRLSACEADAWELLQETWLKLFRSLSSLRDPQSLPSFLYTTARNTAISRMRNHKVHDAADTINEVSDETATTTVQAFDNAEQVHHALDQLPLAQREALTLYFLHDLSLEEMATLLDVPLGTVKSRIHYGKLALRSALSGTNHDR